jgi:L-threonylcarbamoyladenylate synthase
MNLSPFVAALRRGEIVAFPTESSYGLAVDALSEPALARLFALKEREPGKPPPLLVDGESMLARLVERVPARARELMAKHWPGPLTLVLPARAGLPEPLVLEGGVGARKSPHPIADALCEALGAPLTATSANLSGAPPAMTAAEVRAAFGDRVHVLDGGRAGGGKPSTVVRVADDGTLTILRAGAIDPAQL